MEIKLLKRRKLKKRGFLPEIELPEVVTELPEKVEAELGGGICPSEKHYLCIQA